MSSQQLGAFKHYILEYFQKDFFLIICNQKMEGIKKEPKKTLLLVVILRINISICIV